MARSDRPPLLPVLAVNFIATLGFSVVIPFLVFVVTDFGGNAVLYGLVGATYPALQLVGAPVLGRWSDRVGRRLVLLVSQAGTLVAWLVFLSAFFVPRTELFEVDSRFLGEFTLTLPLVLLFLARAVDGLTGGNISVANAYVADLSDEETRNRNFGRMGISSNLGFVAGPALASVLGWLGADYIVPVIACVLISFVATVLIVVILPESRPTELDRGPTSGSIRKVFGQGHRNCIDAARPRQTTLAELVKKPGLGVTFALYFLVFLAFNFFYTSFPAHAVAALHWEVSDTGAFFVVLSLAMVIVQGPVLERVSRWVTPSALIVVGNALLAVNFLLLMLSTTVGTYMAALAFALGNGLMWPSVLAMLAQKAGPEDQGAAQGVAGSLGSAASIAGLVIGGLLYEAEGAMTFGVSAAIISAATLLVLPQVRLRPAAALQGSPKA